MAIDRNRGSFVKEEWRYPVQEEPEVLAEQPQARIIKLDTNLDLAAAEAFGKALLAEYKNPAQAYSLTLEGVEVIGPSDFINSPPTFLLNVTNWPVKLIDLLRTVSVEVNYDEWKTTVLMKGAMK